MTGPKRSDDDSSLANPHAPLISVGRPDETGLDPFRPER